MNLGSEAIVTKLRDQILNGEFSPGFHLQESPLASALGVSRTPIREALMILAQEGLLEPGPRRGFKVRSFTLKDVLDAYEVRANLEGLAARLLAERGMNRNARRILEGCLQEGDTMLDKGSFGPDDQIGWLEMNNRFHTTLIEDTENLMLINFVHQSHKVPLASARHVHWYRLDENNYQLAKRAHQFHHDIFEAIMNRQAVRAAALMSEHIYFSQQQLAKYVDVNPVRFGVTGTSIMESLSDGNELSDPDAASGR